MSNNYIKESKLYLQTAVKNNKTILKDSFFTAPFKITNPFYDEANNLMKLCIMSASPGMLEGDRYVMKYVLEEGSRLHLFSQSYNKIFSMKEDSARQDVEITIKSGASLEYYLYPTIPYKASAFKGNTKFFLEEDSDLIYREIISCGRYGMGEKFEFKEFSSRVSIYKNEKLIFFDNTHLQPAQQDIQGLGLYEAFTHAANIFIVNKEANEEYRKVFLKLLRDYEGIECGISILEFGTIIRILGKSSDRLMKITDDLRIMYEELKKSAY